MTRALLRRVSERRLWASQSLRAWISDECAESFEIVTNYLSRRTAEESKKAPRISVGTLLSTFSSCGQLCGSRRCAVLGARRRATAYFADFKTHEAADAHVLAEFNNGFADHLTNGDAFVLDVMLLVEAVFFVKLFHFAVHDFFNHRIGLPGCACLSTIDFALLVQHLRCHFFATHVTRIKGRDVHGDVVAELLENGRARDEIRLAIDFYEHTNLTARVDVAAHQTFAGFTLRFFRGRSLPFLAQDADGLFDVAAGFDQRCSAIGKPRIGALPQLFHQLGGNIVAVGCWLCAHSSSLLTI